LRRCLGWILVSGYERDGGGKTAVRDRNSGVGRGRYSRGDTWHHFEGDGRIVARLCFFAAAAEHEGVAALQSHHALPFPRELDDQRVDVLLRNRFTRTRSASLADVVQFGHPGLSGIGWQDRRVGKRVVDDRIG
jgi:hypothetical protein